MPLSEFSLVFFPHHDLPLVLLLNLSGFSPSLLSCLSAVSVSFQSSYPSCCLLFFPLTILLIVFSYPLCCSFHPLFCHWGLSPPSGFSPFNPSHCPYFHFLPALLLLLKAGHLWSDYRTSETTVMGQQENKH